MKCRLTYLLALLLTLSCTSNNRGNKAERIVIESAKPLSSIIDEVRYVSLKSDENPFSGRIDKLMSKGDTMFIQDLVNTNSLKAYNTYGEFLFSVGQIGRGPREYLEMTSFTIDSQYIYCLDNGNRRLITYDIHNGKYVDKRALPSFYASDFALFDDGNFIFYVDDKPSLGGGTFITNKKFEIIEELTPITENNYCLLSTQNAFTQNENSIIFSSYAKDTIVVFDRKSYTTPARYYAVDFGDFKATKSDKRDFDQLGATKHLVPPVYVFGNRIIGNTNVPTDAKANYFMYGSFAYDMLGKQTYLNANIEDILDKKTALDTKLVFPLEGIVGNEIVSILNSYDKYPELVELGFPKAPQHIESQLAEGEPILVFYRLR